MFCFKDILGLYKIYIWLKEGIIVLEITLQFTFLVSRTKTNVHKCNFFHLSSDFILSFYLWCVFGCFYLFWGIFCMFLGVFVCFWVLWCVFWVNIWTEHLGAFGTLSHLMLSIQYIMLQVKLPLSWQNNFRITCPTS